MTERLDTTRLQHLARAYCQSAVLFSAIDLGLFTHVDAGAADIDALAAAMGISRLNAERLVTVCLAMDLLRPSDGGLVNAPDAQRYLVEGTPGYAGPWMKFTRPDVAGWFDLTSRLTSPEPPSRLGMYEGLTVERARSYHQATASIGMGAGRRFCRHVDLSGRHRLLDLGGGSGAYSIAAAEAFEGLEAVVFDLPPVVVVTREYIERHGAGDRVSAVAGDFTADPLPTGCDVAVMASNLPIYDSDTIELVVSNTFGVLDPGGEFHLVGEMLDADGVGPLDAALWGMQEILYGGGGRAHSVTECVGYLETAGFVDVAEHEFVPGILRRVSGTKPASR
jgi:hypothetical protein